VFGHLISGQLNKQVAYDLGTAERTIKAHRHNIMEKLGAGSIADLVRLAGELNIPPVRGE
jgi:FixJ family two-component response regulator